ncbi:MAG TPA: lipase maturation factor family protein [Opitutaceae bacterium]
MEQDASRTPPSFANGTRLFVCVLAAVYAAAYASIWVQADGLIGSSGILPAGQFLRLAREQLGRSAWYELPTLCWIFGTGHFIGILCGLGVCVSVVLFLGFAQAPCLALLWAGYLSLVCVGQIFFDFQWDGLLLETTLLAIFVVPWTLARAREPFDPPRLGRYLVWWLLFRLMFLSGVVKLTSGDRTWSHLRALGFHYQTQPLPTPLAWFAHQLPAWFQVGSCAVMFGVELGAPFCILAPRRIRHGAALAMIALQVAIAMTGNYAFFNLLTIALCLTCLDDNWWRDRHWGVVVPAENPQEFHAIPARVRATATRWFAAFAVGVTFFETVAAVSPGAAASPIVRTVAEAVGPSRSFNDYGLFAVMTVERPELIFEGSDDGRDWREYTLPYKPGTLARRPTWVAPHQPRLDWQLWFAALGSPDDNPWVGRVCELLLRGDPALLGLFSHNPFPAHPPLYMRVVRYRYEFTSEAERSRTGNWWRRTPIDFYMPAMSLSSQTK